MKKEDFTLTLITDESPHRVFGTIKDVRAWWSGFYDEKFEGKSDAPGDEFGFWAGGGAHYTKQKLVALVPDKKVEWLVTESNLDFLVNKEEWLGTRIRFEISRKADKTHLKFTHEGLTAESECYTSCEPGWMLYLQNKLAPMINAEGIIC